MSRPAPKFPVSPAAWEASERIRRAKEQPPLAPMLVDPMLAHLTMQAFAEPPAVFVSGFIVMAIDSGA